MGWEYFPAFRKKQSGKKVCVSYVSTISPSAEGIFLKVLIILKRSHFLLQGLGGYGWHWSRSKVISFPGGNIHTLLLTFYY